jgi:integrase
MRPRNGEYGIFPKMIRGNIIFYYWIYDEHGKRKFRSTGKNNYNDAIKHCRLLQIKGRLYISTSYNFTKYTNNFFDYEKCPYIQNRLLRGYSYGRTWAQRQRNILVNIIQPYFNDADIRNISSRMIDDFILNLNKKHFGQKSLNHILSTIKVIFKYAEQTGIIDFNPAEGIKPFLVRSKEKGIFSKQELYDLFCTPYQSGIWKNKMHFLINYIAATTGMRLGECLSLRPENISGNTITVNHSWNRLDGLKGTKTGKVRFIPLCPELEKVLSDYIIENNCIGFLFSTNCGVSPIDHKTVYKHFWNALIKIKIDKKIRETRNLSFHSYRHTFNTMLLEAGVHPETVRLVTGHSAAMTAHYSHIQLENMPNVIQSLGLGYTPAQLTG